MALAYLIQPGVGPTGVTFQAGMIMTKSGTTSNATEDLSFLASPSTLVPTAAHQYIFHHSQIAPCDYGLLRHPCRRGRPNGVRLRRAVNITNG